MKQRSLKWFGYLFSFTFLFISCSGTKLTHIQLDKTHTIKPASNILVIGITGNEDSRRSFEREFVRQLKSVGVEAVSSEEAIPMPADLKMKKEVILHAVDQFKNDAVIITNLINKEIKDTNIRGSQLDSGFYGFYLMRHSYAYDPGYSRTSKTILLETNLYDVKTEKLIWSGQSKTLSKDSKYQIINDVIKVVIHDLTKNQLIAPK